VDVGISVYAVLYGVETVNRKVKAMREYDHHILTREVCGCLTVNALVGDGEGHFLGTVKKIFVTEYDEIFVEYEVPHIGSLWKCKIKKKEFCEIDGEMMVYRDGASKFIK
jgi:hypothetical protein